jgi:prepilin-type N-terminal cleavage/methylation domain-containing protein
MIKRKGFTMVEMVATVVVIGILFYGVIAIFITSGFKGVNVEIYTVAQALAEGKLEEVMAQEFVANVAESETNYTGEVLDHYSYQVVQTYVTSTELNTPAGGPTDYKKISVLIRHDKLGNPVTMECIKTNFEP